MKSPRHKLEDWLDSHGWELARIYEDDLEWWADEVWELSSTWSPNGTPAFITFLVDPQWQGNRKKGQGVWGIGGCARFPDSRPEAGEVTTMSFKSPPEAEFERFLDALDRLRAPPAHNGA